MDEEISKLKVWYEEQLFEKDKAIERLKKEKEVLLSAAIKQAEIQLGPPNKEKFFGLKYHKTSENKAYKEDKTSDKE